MHTASVRRCVAILVAAVLVGCAALAPDSDEPGTAPETVRGSDCFNPDFVYNYRPLSNRTMLVWSPNRNCAYLLGVGVGCTRLRTAHSIAFADRDGRICGFGDDNIVIGGTFRETCSVTGVEKLSPERLLAIAPEYARENEDGEITNCGQTMSK